MTKPINYFEEKFRETFFYNSSIYLEPDTYYKWRSAELECDMSKMSKDELERMFRDMKNQKVDSETEEKIIKMISQKSFEIYHSGNKKSEREMSKEKKERYLNEVLKDGLKKYKDKDMEEFKKFIKEKMDEYDKKNPEIIKEDTEYLLDEMEGKHIIVDDRKRIVKKKEFFELAGKYLAEKLRENLKKKEYDKSNHVRRPARKRIDYFRTVKKAWMRSGESPFKDGNIKDEDIYCDRKKVKAVVYFIPDFSGSVAGENLEQIQLNMASIYYYLKGKKDDVIAIPFGLNKTDLKLIESEADMEYILQLTKKDLGGCTPLSPAIREARRHASKLPRKTEKIMLILTDSDINATDGAVSPEDLKRRLNADIYNKLGDDLNREVYYELAKANNEGFKTGYIHVGESFFEDAKLMMGVLDDSKEEKVKHGHNGVLIWHKKAESADKMIAEGLEHIGG